MGELKEEISQLKGRLSDQKRRLKVQEEEHGVLEIKYSETKSQLSDAQSGHGEQEEQWQSRIQAKDAALEHAEAEVVSLQRQLASKEEELMTLLHSSVQSSDLASRKLAASSEKLLAAQAELETAQDRVTHLETVDTRRKAEVEELRSALTAEIQALTEEKSALRASCNLPRPDEGPSPLHRVCSATGNFTAAASGSASSSQVQAQAQASGAAAFGSPISPSDSHAVPGRHRHPPQHVLPLLRHPGDRAGCWRGSALSLGRT